MLALVPAALFYMLDAYYLSLERGFRRSYNVFVARVHSQELRTSDLYYIAPSGSIPRGVIWAMFNYKSFSVWPFYLALIGTVVLARCFI